MAKFAQCLRFDLANAFAGLGVAATIHVNVRMIAATHRDLRAMIQAEKFREDLFYRFNVFPIEIPPCGNGGRTFRCW